MADTPRAEAIKLRIQQLQTRLSDIEKRSSTINRAADTRRKVILGGWLMDQAKTDDEARNRITEIVASLTRKQDIAAFKDWTLRDE